MSGYNGSGTFQISGIGLPFSSGSVISSSVVNTLNQALADGLTNCITKDGQQTVTADISFNTHRLKNVADATATSDAINMSQMQSGAALLVGSVAGTNTITGSLTPAITSYVTGCTYRFFAVGNNTGAVTLSINSITPKAITKNGTTALEAGDISTGVLITVTYDGTQFQLNNISAFSSGTFTNLTATSLVVGSAFTATGGIVIDGKVSLGASALATNNGATYIANGAQSHTTLSGSVTVIETTSLALTDGTGFPTGGGTIIIDNEQITYATRSGNTLSTLTRNVNGTGVSAHSSGAAVSSLTFPSTTLAADLTSTDVTSMTVASQANFPTTGTVLIGTEEIAYTGKNTSPDRLTGLTRGVNGSKAAAHSTSAAVTGNQLLVSSSGYTYDQSTKQLQADNISAKVNLSGAAIVPTGSTMPANGFYFPAANTVALATYSTTAGNSVQAWRVDSNGYMISDLANYALIQGAVWTSTSLTLHNWTGIPSWAKKITIMFSGVSNTGSAATDIPLIRLGYGGTPTYINSGYLGCQGGQLTTGVNTKSYSAGFLTNIDHAATYVHHGIATLINVGGTKWAYSCSIGLSDSSRTSWGGGSIDIGNTLTAIQVTTEGPSGTGTSTFTAGTFNILVE